MEWQQEWTRPKIHQDIGWNGQQVDIMMQCNGSIFKVFGVLFRGGGLYFEDDVEM